MALDSPYATAAEYRATVNKPGTNSDATINRQLVAISRYIERKCDRFFNQDAAATTRIYIAGEKASPFRPVDEIFVADLVSVTSITLDEDADGDFTDDTALAATDYELLPRSANTGPEPRPYTSIAFTSYGNYGSIAAGTRVQVVGVHGWPSVPVAIKEVAIALGSLLRLETSRATTEIPAGLDATLDASPDAQRIIHSMLSPYVRQSA